MAELNETPSGSRTHIAFFGLRNAGKSTLVNAFTGQEVAIVSNVAGTTTDPVSKAMEILPLGPCLITDTAGLDDEGALGEERVRRSLAVLATTDVAVWVCGDGDDAARQRLVDDCRKRNVPVVEYHRGEDVGELRRKIASLGKSEETPPLVADLVSPGDTVICVCPIDSAAPKGRLILPQQQVIRELLDTGCNALVCKQNADLAGLCRMTSPKFVITDSQAFKEVNAAVPEKIPLTSFSVVFARAKGDLKTYCEGAEALKNLKDGDKVLIAEGCTHHRQCNDIGTVKLPKWIEGHSGRRLEFEFASGNDFPDPAGYALVVQCGGCMLTRRAVLSRIEKCREAKVPVTNYGICIAACNGIKANGDTCMVERKARNNG